MKRICLFFTLLTILLYSADVYSQTTHAHSTTRQWHGINVQDIVDHIGDDTWLNANYSKIKQTYTYNGKDSKGNDVYIADEGCGIPVYLYNVGLDKFAIEGGDWGMEARLFYNDFGRQMMLILEESSLGNNDWQLRINSHVIEQSNSNKCRLTFNVPGVTKSSSWSSTDVSFTTIMDGYKKHARWDFERVETDPASDVYTFRMSQKYDNPDGSYKYVDSAGKTQTIASASAANIIFRFGAAYGEWFADGSDKGRGFYVHIDDDRSCWTSAGNPHSGEASPWGNKTKVQVGSDMIEIDELYQWRLVSADEFDRVLNEETVGLNPSISSLVPDRDFTRNSNEFAQWQKTSLVNENDKTDGFRFGYTWGYFSPGKYALNSSKQNNYIQYKEERWNKAIMLKQSYNTIKTAKYGYMTLEGCAKAYVRFEVPHPGWYEVEYVAINFAPENHPAYFYALADGATERPGWATSTHTAMYGYQEMPITRMNNLSILGTSYNDIDFPSDATKQNKGSEEMTISVGKALTSHGDDFSHKFWIYLDPTYYNS